LATFGGRSGDRATITAIAKVVESLDKAQNIKVGAQNMHWENSGALPAKFLRHVARSFCSLRRAGHSERASFSARPTKL